MTPSIWLACGLTFTIAVIANKLGIMFSSKIGLYSVPSARRRHGRPIPVSGGLWIFLSFACGLVFYSLFEPDWFAQNRDNLVPTMVCLAATTVLGYFDDLKVLRVRSKFLVQLAICAAAFSIPQVQSFCAAFRPAFGYTVYPLVLVFIVGVTNAINFIDGADGLLSTTLLICFAANVLRGLALNQGTSMPAVQLMAIPAVAGFLVFNWRPAKIFMGDTGSMALGFLLVISCIAMGPAHGQTQWQGTFDEAAAGVLQLGYPILDLLWVIARRLRRGFSPFRADQNHLHHYLLRLGFSVKGCVLILSVLNISLQLTSYAVLNLSMREAWPMVAVNAGLAFMLCAWIVTIDRWKNRELGRVSADGSHDRPFHLDLDATPDFNLVIHAQPLFEGQNFGSAEQAMAAIHSLAFMLESNCPKGSEALWQNQRKTICLVFPPCSVAPEDAGGLQTRIQQLINNWIEMFNVSISAPSLRVTIGAPLDAGNLQSAKRMRLLKNPDSEESAA